MGSHARLTTIDDCRDAASQFELNWRFPMASLLQPPGCIKYQNDKVFLNQNMDSIQLFTNIAELCKVLGVYD